MGLYDQVDKQKELKETKGVRATFVHHSNGIQTETFINATAEEIDILIMSLINLRSKDRDIVDYMAQLTARIMMSKGKKK